LPQQLGASGEHVGAADALTVAGVGRAAHGTAGTVAHPAIFAFFARHDAQRELVVDEGDVERALAWNSLKRPPP